MRTFLVKRVYWIILKFIKIYITQMVNVYLKIMYNLWLFLKVKRNNVNKGRKFSNFWPYWFLVDFNLIKATWWDDRFIAFFQWSFSEPATFNMDGIYALFQVFMGLGYIIIFILLGCFLGILWLFIGIQLNKKFPYGKKLKKQLNFYFSRMIRLRAWFNLVLRGGDFHWWNLNWWALFGFNLINYNSLWHVIHSQFEYSWVGLPTLILFILSVPSFGLIYSQSYSSNADNASGIWFLPELTTRVLGNQWYWTYNYMVDLNLFIKKVLLFYSYDNYMNVINWVLEPRSHLKWFKSNLNFLGRFKEVVVTFLFPKYGGSANFKNFFARSTRIGERVLPLLELASGFNSTWRWTSTHYRKFQFNLNYLNLNNLYWYKIIQDDTFGLIYHTINSMKFQWKIQNQLLVNNSQLLKSWTVSLLNWRGSSDVLTNFLNSWNFTYSLKLEAEKKILPYTEFKVLFLPGLSLFNETNLDLNSSIWYYVNFARYFWMWFIPNKDKIVKRENGPCGTNVNCFGSNPERAFYFNLLNIVRTTIKAYIYPNMFIVHENSFFFNSQVFFDSKELKCIQFDLGYVPVKHYCLLEPYYWRFSERIFKQFYFDFRVVYIWLFDEVITSLWKFPTFFWLVLFFDLYYLNLLMKTNYNVVSGSLTLVPHVIHWEESNDESVYEKFERLLILHRPLYDLVGGMGFHSNHWVLSNCSWSSNWIGSFLDIIFCKNLKYSLNNINYYFLKYFDNLWVLTLSWFFIFWNYRTYYFNNIFCLFNWYYNYDQLLVVPKKRFSSDQRLQFLTYSEFLETKFFNVIENLATLKSSLNLIWSCAKNFNTVLFEWIFINMDGRIEKLEYPWFFYKFIETLNSLVLPVMTNIRLLFSSSDVIHSWAVPAFGVKMDACPGWINELDIRIVNNGVFFGQCSEICGVDHAFMPITLVILDIATYLFSFLSLSHKFVSNIVKVYK